MISNINKTILINGVNKASSVCYKRSDTDDINTDIPSSVICVSDGNDGYYGGSAIVVTDEIKGYFVKSVLLHKASVYNISGVVTPGDRMVFISKGIDMDTPEGLKNNIVKETYADKEGNFCFKNFNYTDGTLALWTVQLAQDSATASLTYETSVVGYNPNIGNLLSYNFTELAGTYMQPVFTITGSCSEDVEAVYVSKTSDIINVTNLMESMCSSIAPDNCKFEIKCSGEYEQNYTVWALTKLDGNLVIDNIKVSDGFSTCLSGDTMITMEDGSYKRMDKICVNDVVMSKDGVSRVTATCRGHFNNHHILYYFEDGTVIDETHHHRFYNVDQGFWQRLQLWNIGDHAINQENNKVALVSVKHLDELSEMFGIWTEDGTYYANSLLSGTASCNKSLLAEVTAEQAVEMMLSAEEEMLIELMGLGGVLP